MVGRWIERYRGSVACAVDSCVSMLQRCGDDDDDSGGKWETTDMA